MPFEFRKLGIAGVVLVEPKVFGDSRGFFVETYKKSDFEKAGIGNEFIQDNHSKSSRGVLRGMHYQLPPFSQAKLVRCIQGEILDVVIDIRKGSETFGKWVSETLSADNKRMLYVPVGFAHGFLTLSETAEVAYKVDAEYSPVHDRGVLWDDPDVGINWPDVGPILVSDKDRNLPFLRDAELFA